MSRWQAAAWLVLACAACDSGPPRPRFASAPSAAGRAGAYRSSTGTLAGYDAVSRVLTLRAAGADSRYRVAEDARVWVGSHSVPAAQLASHVGAEVTLAYGEAEHGARTTHTVRLREAHPR